MQSHYTTLQISPSSSLKQIKMAFKRQIREHHPDKNISVELTTFQEANFDHLKQQKKKISMKIIEAYQCLIDPEKRKVYDQQLKMQTLKCQFIQLRHKHTVSLSEECHSDNKFTENCSKLNEKILEKSFQEKHPQKYDSQQNTEEEEEDTSTILVCQQCFGENYLTDQQLENINKIQLSINCRYCGLYITILE